MKKQMIKISSLLFVMVAMMLSACDDYRCLVVGVERGDGNLIRPDVNMIFCEGDVVWVVGERDDVYHLLGKKKEIQY